MTKIAVIGLGLIGGSIFKDLLTLGYDCIGISQSQQGIEHVYSDYSYLKDRELITILYHHTQWQEQNLVVGIVQ